jgi:hypothetical protein
VTRLAGALALGLALAGGLGAPVGAAVAPAAGASLLAEVEPREPWVGQPVVLRVRLVLLRDLAEEPEYVPPVTTGFWAELASRPESYYATVSGRRALVTETRTRLYPLAPGIARVGSATASVVFSRPDGPRGPSDAEARQQVLRSAPVAVTVRPLPAGAPAGFEGAVGTFSLAWSADRTGTSQDVPVAVRLDVRGSGNLALVQAPALVTPGAEVLVGAREDSLPLAGSSGAGRVRFQWNVLARRTGPLAIDPPRFAWFDPGAGSYRSAVLPVLSVEVGRALFSSSPSGEGFPEVFARDAPDPFARGPRPWALALAGLLLGAALTAWRVRQAPDPLAEVRNRVAAWRNVLRGPDGPAFWRAAEEAVEWLGRAGRPLGGLQERVAATRYGGAGADVGAVRAQLQEELAAVAPPPRRLPWSRPAAVALAVLGIAAVAASWSRPGKDSGEERLRVADRFAREGSVARAQGAWLGIWKAGGRAPALAARLAWVDLTQGHLAPATVWVLRGERTEARDRALAWVANLVREGGGLAGAGAARLPLRRAEWGLLGLALGFASGALWPRRGAALALALLALAVAGVGPVEGLRAGGVAQAVMSRTVELEGSGLQLEVGQVVEVSRREGAWARVRVGRDLAGRVPANALEAVTEAR